MDGLQAMIEALIWTSNLGTCWLPAGRRVVAKISVALSCARDESTRFYFRTTLFAPFTFSFAP
jgi:hypothetical protein